MQMLRDQIGQHVYPVHRLDKPTSGVLLFALNADSARKMSELFRARETEKEYLAVVRGYTDEKGLIDYPLKEELDRKSDSRAVQDKAAQDAVTEYCRISTVELPYHVGRYQSARYSLVRLKPSTGRKHQLRRHMKHIFHPIVGDTSHGDGKQNSFFRDRFSCHRLLLAAVRLGFIHPETNESLEIGALPGADFSDLIEALGWCSAEY